MISDAFVSFVLDERCTARHSVTHNDARQSEERVRARRAAHHANPSPPSPPSIRFPATCSSTSNNSDRACACASHDSHLCGSSTFQILSSESVSTRNGDLEISVARRARTSRTMEDEESHSRRSVFILYM